jgi:hypothetical protein
LVADVFFSALCSSAIGNLQLIYFAANILALY